MCEEFYIDDMLKKPNKYDGNNCDIKRNQSSMHKEGILTLMMNNERRVTYRDWTIKQYNLWLDLDNKTLYWPIYECQGGNLHIPLHKKSTYKMQIAFQDRNIV